MKTLTKPTYRLFKCDCGHTTIQDNIYTVNTFNCDNTRDLCATCWQNADLELNEKPSAPYTWRFATPDAQQNFNHRQY